MSTRSFLINAAANITKTPKSFLYTVAELINDLVAAVNELRTDHLGTGTSYQVLLTELKADHATFKTAVDETKTAVDELIDDHATFKTAVDEGKTAVDELIDDHATFKTAVDEGKTAIDELIDDHATFKTAVDEGKTAIDELIDDHATFKTAADGVETLIEEMYDDEEAKRNLLAYLAQDGVIGGTFAFTAAAAATLTGSGFVIYRIGGEIFFADLDTTITLEDSGDIADSKYGAWRILLDRAGACTTQDTGAQMAFANAQDALLNLSAVAPTANTVTVGYLVLQTSGAVFDIGTTVLNAGTVANLETFAVRGPRRSVSGLHTALGASVTADPGASTWSVGTVDVKRNGIRLAQIGAIANQVVDDADTVAAGNAGGWLLVVDKAGTGVYLLAADGVAGAVSAMTYADKATADAAVDTLEDQLPELFVPIGKIVVENGSAGLFTAGATNWNAADITTTATDATVATFDRADSGFDSHQIAPPTIAAALASSKPASAPATLTATKPTAGPATLAATKPTAGPATLAATKATAGPATLAASKPTAGPATLTASVPAALSAAAVDDISFRELGTP